MCDSTYDLQRQWEDQDPTTAHINKQNDRIAELKAEVARLKSELDERIGERDRAWIKIGMAIMEGRLSPNDPAPSEAETLSQIPPMPPTSDRRPYEDDKPDGYLESNQDWTDANDDAVSWLVENHRSIRAALRALSEGEIK